jgi:hypothetical protein
MTPEFRKSVKICVRVGLFCVPIICLICGIVIQKEGLVIGGAMGILLAFIISIMTEFHERQLQRRQNSVRILVRADRDSVRNITIDIASTEVAVIESIPEEQRHVKSKDKIECGSPKVDEETRIEISKESM